ncbi:MAG: DUF934 domain-containing protein [Stellaceae bacterium]
MPLIKDGRFVADPWRHVADDEPLPDAPRITVSWARWSRERAALANRPCALGLRLPNDVRLAQLAEELPRFALIVLDFPRFTDGRAYSQARLLRRLGFKDELRASGNVLRDQLLFMRRCGFDSFTVGERAHFEGWLAAFREFDLFYQPPAADRQMPLLKRRLLERSGGFTLA